MAILAFAFLPFGCASGGFHVNTHRIDTSRDSGVSWPSRTCSCFFLGAFGQFCALHRPKRLPLFPSASSDSCVHKRTRIRTGMILIAFKDWNGHCLQPRSRCQTTASQNTIVLVSTGVSVVNGTLATPCDLPHLESRTHSRFVRCELLCLSDSMSVASSSSRFLLVSIASDGGPS